MGHAFGPLGTRPRYCSGSKLCEVMLHKGAVALVGASKRERGVLPRGAIGFAIGARGALGQRRSLPAEDTVIGVTATQGNLGGGELVLQQQSRRLCKACLMNLLPGRELKDFLAVTLQLGDRYAGLGHPRGKADGACELVMNRLAKAIQAGGVSSRHIRVSMRAGLKGGRGAEGCQPNR